MLAELDARAFVQGGEAELSIPYLWDQGMIAILDKARKGSVALLLFFSANRWSRCVKSVEIACLFHNRRGAGATVSRDLACYIP